MNPIFLRFFAAFVFLPTLFSAAVAAPPCDDPNPLRFSMAPSVKMNQLLAEYQPLIDQLEQSLGRKVVVVQPASYNTVIAEMLSGNVDLASMGPASYSIAKSRDPSITAFATWTLKGGTFIKAGSNTYNSLLVTLKVRGIHTIADLKGKSVVLSDPASTSGAVIPRAEFGESIGQPLETYFAKVGYSGSHDRSLEMLKKGYVDAAFVASQRVDDALNKGLLSANEITILWRSRPILHDPFVYRGNLCPALQEKIRQTFLNGGGDIQKLLTAFHAERFVEVNDDDYKYIRQVLSQQR
ncbi:MAG TPA: phosphate/phosphite/phosphonate ABC transporter substrate-binding protein [Rhodocyclaceae bacterium]|nr:phosphate/phosphite/phosphonate ABC transporter substrate-binding protein [Rhodocyclaceae bacterium]